MTPTTTTTRPITLSLAHARGVITDDAARLQLARSDASSSTPPQTERRGHLGVTNQLLA